MINRYYIRIQHFSSRPGKAMRLRLASIVYIYRASLELLKTLNQHKPIESSIICFSVRVFDNSLLVSKLFRLQNRVSFLRNFNFQQRYLGKVHYVLEINLISEGTLIKAFHLPNKTFNRNPRHGFVDKRQLKIIMPK